MTRPVVVLLLLLATVGAACVHSASAPFTSSTHAALTGQPGQPAPPAPPASMTAWARARRFGVIGWACSPSQGSAQGEQQCTLTSSTWHPDAVAGIVILKCGAACAPVPKNPSAAGAP